jgi:hypothetical protein
LLGVALAVVVGAGAAGVVALAQEAAESPPRPVTLHRGSCEELGEAVEALSTATLPENVPLERVGQDAATPAETSFSTLPLTLDELLAEPFALAVAQAEDAPDDVVACGEIGGIVDENGALTLGLRERAGSGIAGIAYLFPATESPSTLASIFVAPTRPVGEPAATPVPQVVVEETVVMSSDGTPIVVRVERTPTPVPPTPTPTPAPVIGAVDVVIADGEIAIPERIQAGPIVFVVTNDGTEPHDFWFANDLVGSFFLDENLQPGETATLSVNLPPGTYTAFCSLDDGAHAAAGEQATVEVVAE